ncbi:hypothetical protein ACG0Z4_20940 [Enterocloster aldenensis]|uniref:hypothetical protein n=1 Tax=Enterocloster aldenensis TaxID=358742 RepID=UPI004029BF76
MEKITLTDNQKAIVTRLGDATYTPEYLEEWLNRSDSVYINAPAALSSMGANGFYKAVLAIERAEQTGAAAAGKPAAPATTPKKRTPKKTEVKQNENDNI